MQSYDKDSNKALITFYLNDEDEKVDEKLLNKLHLKYEAKEINID